jgi:hypothetical protein
MSLASDAAHYYGNLHRRSPYLIVYTIGDWAGHFRSSPISGQFPSRLACLKSANRRLMHRSKQHRYSITSSARASSVGGTSRPHQRHWHS